MKGFEFETEHDFVLYFTFFQTNNFNDTELNHVPINPTHFCVSSITPVLFCNFQIIQQLNTGCHWSFANVIGAWKNDSQRAV